MKNDCLFIAEQPKGLLDALASLFLKLDYGACQRCEKTWKLFADTLKVYLTTGHDKNGLDELWDKRLDWWPRFHFRPNQVPDRASASELEWQLAQHKAEVARLFLGKGLHNNTLCGVTMHHRMRLADLKTTNIPTFLPVLSLFTKFKEEDIH